MTGWRVAYLHTDESIAQEILKVHDSLVTCAPVISQYAAMGALEMGDRDIEFFNQEYRKRRDLICRRLDKLAHVFSYVKPTSAYYVFPKIHPVKSAEGGAAWPQFNGVNCPDSLSWKFALWLLEKAQVAVVPGVAFGPSGEGHVRMSFGRSEKDINRAFDRMDELFSKNR